VDNTTKGTLVTGYLVGCQVDLSGGLSLGRDVYVSPSSVTPEIAPSISLVPGGVSGVKLDTKQLDPTAGHPTLGPSALRIPVAASRFRGAPAMRRHVRSAR
jgi:hypothetical protein